MLLLTGQWPQEEAVVPVVVVALLAAFVRAPTAGRAVPGGVARLVGTPGDTGVSAHEPRANHADAPVSGRGGWLGLDVEVLMTGGEVQV